MAISDNYFGEDLKNNIYDTLNELNIPFQKIDNEAITSMEECEDVENALGVEIRKSIFLCNRTKSEFYLLVMPSKKRFNTKMFSEKVVCSRTSFASTEHLKSVLGLTPGSITIMGLVNDRSHTVQLVIDSEIVNEEWFGCNAGLNTSHIKLKTRDLLDIFLKHTGHKPIVVKL